MTCSWWGWARFPLGADAAPVSRRAAGHPSDSVPLRLWPLRLIFFGVSCTTSKKLGNGKPQPRNIPECQDISTLLTLYKNFEWLALNSHKPAQSKNSSPPLLTSADVSFLHAATWVSLGSKPCSCSSLGKQDSYLFVKKRKKYTSKSYGNTCLHSRCNPTKQGPLC